MISPQEPVSEINDALLQKRKKKKTHKPDQGRAVTLLDCKIYLLMSCPSNKCFFFILTLLF